jgi:hypothetical protein
MLHRITLRVLPSLSQAVTTVEVRKRKRVVMLVPGLVAFALYRLAKQVAPISDIWVLLTLSGLISAATALVAYGAGRQRSVRSLWREDGMRRLGWVVGWIGFAYGIQLSLMVLALLKVVVQYDFLQHPDGPAMMAIIIACTSVARDAFEIGHIRRLQQSGEPFVTFPDGAALRALLSSYMTRVIWPVLIAASVTIVLALVAAEFSPAAASHLGQLVLVSAISGTVSLAAYLLGKQPGRAWLPTIAGFRWTDLFRFWWWPGLAFAATYYLSLQGLLLFMVGTKLEGRVSQGLIAGTVGAGMTLYCYYLGNRRAIEDRLFQNVPTSLLRCPFVLGILSKSRATPVATSAATEPAVAASEGMILRERERG